MYDPFPHLVNRNNCTLPLRLSLDSSVCGDLHAVHTRTEAANTATYGATNHIINYRVSSMTITGNEGNEQSPNKSIKEPAASPAAGGASDDCICLEFIGDNGPRPVHGTRGQS